MSIGNLSESGKVQPQSGTGLPGASPVSFSRGLVLTACAIYLIRHIGLPDTGSGRISASTLNTVLSNPGVITSSGCLAP